MFTKLLYIQSNILIMELARVKCTDMYYNLVALLISVYVCMYAYMRMYNKYVQNYTIMRIQTNILYCST